MLRKPIHLLPEFWIMVILLIGSVVHQLNKRGIDLVEMSTDCWPLIFLGLGVFQLTSVRFRDVSSSMILILIGIGLTLYNLGVLDPDTLENLSPQRLKSIIDYLFNALGSSFFSSTFNFGAGS